MKIQKITAVLAVAAAASFGGQAMADGIVVPFNVNGILSMDPFGDPDNVVIMFDFAAALGFASGTSVKLNGIGWDVTIATNDGSWLSEARVGLTNTTNTTTGLFLAPGAANGAPGTMTYSQPLIKLSTIPIADVVCANGILRMEFFDSFDDLPGAADATWSGTIFLQGMLVPAPGAIALLGLAGVVGPRRRRA